MVNAAFNIHHSTFTIQLSICPQNVEWWIQHSTFNIQHSVCFHEFIFSPISSSELCAGWFNGKFNEAFELPRKKWMLLNVEHVESWMLNVECCIHHSTFGGGNRKVNVNWKVNVECWMLNGECTIHHSVFLNVECCLRECCSLVRPAPHTSDTWEGFLIRIEACIFPTMLSTGLEPCFPQGI